MRAIEENHSRAGRIPLAHPAGGGAHALSRHHEGGTVARLRAFLGGAAAVVGQQRGAPHSGNRDERNNDAKQEAKGSPAPQAHIFNWLGCGASIIIVAQMLQGDVEQQPDVAVGERVVRHSSGTAHLHHPVRA